MNGSQGSRTACRGLEFPGIGRGIFYSLNEHNPGFDGRIAERRPEYDLHSNRYSIQEDDEVIYSYSRAQALADGVLVDVSRMAAEANFRYPAAISCRPACPHHAQRARESAGPELRRPAVGHPLHGVHHRSPSEDQRIRPASRSSLFEAEADPAPPHQPQHPEIVDGGRSGRSR